ncbi:MAG: hypothetical protein J6A75_12420 [Lachnospiraceae bacterium]|nr:hypothetical protein [Lachnospiraceae bacterium]
MKIEAGSLLEKTLQKENPFEKARITTEFSDIVKGKKTGDIEHTFRMGQIGYDKDEVTAKSAVEEFQEKMAGQLSAAERKDQMSVLANTLSEEDYRKLQEDGYLDVDDMDSHTITTVVDKIKVQLAKAGVDVSKMADGLSKEQLEMITGSIASANQLQKSFQAADIPVTEKNMSEGMDAYQLAAELQPLSDGAIKYMLDNHLMPSVSNLYKAEYSGSASYVMAEDVQIDFTALQVQIEQVITAAGAEVNAKTIEASQWMIQSEIPYTVDNFSYMQKLRGLQLPAENTQIADAIALAVAEGDRPADAMLLQEYTLTAQAEHAVQVVTDAADEDIAYLVSNNMEITVESLEQTAKLRQQGVIDLTDAKAVIESSTTVGTDAAENTVITSKELAFLTAKRVLEETRLAMTTEANRALLKQGITIDTKPLEALVEQLKEQENTFYTKLVGESAGALFEETTQKVSDLKQMPAYVLGMRGYNLDTVRGLHEAGQVLQDTFTKAGESYEALMTAPRSDLGDNIQKAFANVDDILTDLGLEISEENQRAVRILAYNSLDITEEAIMTMKHADERVQRTFANLTPATVREMIREGINPLDMNLDVLNQQAEAIRSENMDAEGERFSEYLWKLEQNHGISQEERESYIGIYRLLHQIEKTDGAAIGALISQGAQLTMRNLLTAVRSAKKSGMDYTVDDEFAGVDQSEAGFKSITEQIETAYQNNCMKDVMETLTPNTLEKLLESSDWENYTPEQLKAALEDYAKEMTAQEQETDNAYVRYQLSEIQQAADADEEVYRLLERYELPNTVNNVLAANRLVSKRNQVFSQLFNSEEVFSGEEVDFAAIQEEILQRFVHALKTPKEMAAAQEVLAETAENVMKTMIADKEHITSMDIRELKLMNTQISIAGRMAEEENYTIPVMVGDEVTGMSLKIVRGKKYKGMVEIMFETSKAGKVAACISAKEEGMDGLVAADSPAMKERLEYFKGRLAEAFGEECHLNFAYEKHLDFARFSQNSVAEQNTDTKEGEEYEVQTARLYKIAKSFLEVVKELEF